MQAGAVFIFARYFRNNGSFPISPPGAGLKCRWAQGDFYWRAPMTDVIHDVIVCKKHVFADSQNKRFPFVFSDNLECGYSNAHTVSCGKRVYDINTSRRATRVGIWGICRPPEIFKTLYSNFDICRNFQMIKLKSCILIIFKKSLAGIFLCLTYLLTRYILRQAI